MTTPPTKRPDTDDALRGEGAAATVRRAFAEAPAHRTKEEADAVKAWLAVLDGVSDVKPSQSAITTGRALVGQLLQDPRGVDQAADITRQEHFAEPAVGAVFAAIVKLADGGRTPDDTLVVDLLRRESKLQEPWPDVLVTCRRSADIGASTPAERAQGVYELWRNRELAALGAALYHRAIGAGAHEAGAILDEVSTRLVNLELPTDTRSAEIGVGDAATAMRADVQKRHELRREGKHALPGMATGWGRLDWLIGGWVGGRVTVVKADTGVGKTAFALTALLNAATQAAKAEPFPGIAYMLTLEMEAQSIAMRMAANVGSVDGQRLLLADLDDDQVTRVVRAERELRLLNDYLRIRYAPGMTIGAVRRLLRRRQRSGRPIKVMVIDYVQLLRAPAERNREQEVAAISTGLVEAAKEFDVHLILLSQVNAEGQARESRRIEQDADTVIKLEPTNDDVPEDMCFIYDCNLEKNRFGPTVKKGNYRLLFMKRFQRMAEVTVSKTDDKAASWYGPEERPRAGVD